VTTPFSTAAPWTFGAAGAASTPGLIVSGAPFTGGSGSTTLPQLYYNCSGSTAATGLSSSGTIFGENTCSGFTGNLLDFRVNGGSAVAKITYTGAMTIAGAINAAGANQLGTGTASTVPLTVYNLTTATADLTDWNNNGSTVASINDLGALTTTNIVDSAISASTSPICANGTGGAFTTSGCTATQTICSGTLSLGTAAIASGAAATTVTATCTGLASTDNIMLDFNSSPLGVVGYQPSTSGTLTIIKWPTANTINVSVVNNTSSSVTPGAITLNYRVTR
jgi:hypothetical protein